MILDSRYVRMLATVLMLAVATPVLAAEDGAWSISKSSGEVWISSGEVQQASLKPEDNLKPGDTIRTGRNGRVLLVRGAEHILIAPNSVVGMPSQPTEGLSTTIIQKAGSILLDVEKRNVKHFEVETPYLAAVVKGTQFRVSVNATSTSVNVLRGQVEVADFKSGQIAQVMPGQKAVAFEHGKPGLSLSGAGSLNPIAQGQPRPSSVNRIPVPKGGLSAPRNAANGHTVRTLAAINRSAGKLAVTANPRSHSAGAPHNGLRISSPIGEVKLNFQKVTHGLARGGITAAQSASRNGTDSTVWSSSGSSLPTSTGGNNANSESTPVNGNNSASTGVTGVSSVAASVAAATNSGSSSNENVNGGGAGNGRGSANANGHGNGNGSGRGPANPGGPGNGPGNDPGGNGPGNGNGHGHGPGGNGPGNGNGNNNGNGNGNNNGNGNGNGNGHGKN